MNIIKDSLLGRIKISHCYRAAQKTMNVHTQIKRRKMNNLSSVTCYLLSFFAFVSFSLVPGIRVCHLLSIEVATSELLDCAVLFLDPF